MADDLCFKMIILYFIIPTCVAVMVCKLFNVLLGQLCVIGMLKLLWPVCYTVRQGRTWICLQPSTWAWPVKLGNRKIRLEKNQKGVYMYYIAQLVIDCRLFTVTISQTKLQCRYA